MFVQNFVYFLASAHPAASVNVYYNGQAFV